MDDDQVATVVMEVARVAELREALISLATRLGDAGVAVQRVQQVDGSADLVPELNVALQHLKAAGECVNSMAEVISARFSNAMDL